MGVVALKLAPLTVAVCAAVKALLLARNCQNVLFEVPLVVEAVLALVVCAAVKAAGGATQKMRGALFYGSVKARQGSAPRGDAARQLVEKVPEEVVMKRDRKMRAGGQSGAKFFGEKRKERRRGG